MEPSPPPKLVGESKPDRVRDGRFGESTTTGLDIEGAVANDIDASAARSRSLGRGDAAPLPAALLFLLPGPYEPDGAGKVREVEQNGPSPDAMVVMLGVATRPEPSRLQLREHAPQNLAKGRAVGLLHPRLHTKLLVVPIHFLLGQVRRGI